VPGSGEHHNDRLPRFQKMNFPKFDGKSDLLVFINRCKSYFHLRRINEEKVWMAAYNLLDTAQLWYVQVERDERTPPWRRFTEFLHLRFSPPLCRATSCTPLNGYLPAELHRASYSLGTVD
jgi:hypothetical protein